MVPMVWAATVAQAVKQALPVLVALVFHPAQTVIRVSLLCLETAVLAVPMVRHQRELVRPVPRVLLAVLEPQGLQVPLVKLALMAPMVLTDLQVPTGRAVPMPPTVPLASTARMVSTAAQVLRARMVCQAIWDLPRPMVLQALWVPMVLIPK